MRHQSSAWSSVARLSCTASQNGSPPPTPSAASAGAGASAKGLRCSSLVERRFRSSGSRRAGAWPIFSKAKSAASSASVRRGSTGSDVPILASRLLTAMGSMPSSPEGIPARASQRSLGELLAIRADDGRSRPSTAEGFEDLDLRGRVDDMVLAADHVGDRKVDVIDHAGQGAWGLAVLADQRGSESVAVSMATSPRTRSRQRRESGSA